ncbi:MAG: hypothetical protein QMC67_08585 [Candidatus Wallbacteria bacterium]
MKFKTFILLVLVMAFLIPGEAFARDNKFKHNGELSIWNTDLYGSLELNNTGYSLKSNFKGDGNFSKKNAASFGWTYSTGKLSDVYVGYTQIKNSGNLRAYSTGNVNFNGVVFSNTGTANINLDIKLDAFDIMGARELTKGEKGYVDFIYGFKIMKFNIDAVGTDAGFTNARSSYSITLPLPNFGVRGVYNFAKDWNFYGMFSGFSINRSGKSGTLKNIDTGFEYHIPQKSVGVDNKNNQKIDWYVQLGYRAEYIKGKDDNNTIVIDHEGPQLKVIGRF